LHQILTCKIDENAYNVHDLVFLSTTIVQDKRIINWVSFTAMKSGTIFLRAEKREEKCAHRP
jgi:hypothetical protein